MEVSKINLNGKDWLRIELKKYDQAEVNIITSIDGWFRGNTFVEYGLPYEKLPEFIKKTKDILVVWKSHNDSMGCLTRGIDSSKIPTFYTVPYTPKIPLRPHQIQGFNLMMQKDSLILADEEGVGKAFQVLCAISAKIKHGVAKHALYITKASLVYDVKNQAERATDLKVVVADGTPKKRNSIYGGYVVNKNVDVIIVSYETFRTDIENFRHIHKEIPFDIMVIDESHKVKSSDTQIGKCIHALDIPQRYSITASPIINELIDLYNNLKWLGLIDMSLFTFKNRYCILDQWGKPISYKNVGEIKALLQSNMLRRLKSDVLKDLPPVIKKNLYVEMTPAQKRIYKAIENGDMQGIDFEDMFFDDVPSELVKHMRLSQVAESSEIVGGEKGIKGSGKLKELESLLEDITDRNEKAIVFSRSKRMTLAMVKYFSKYNPVYITGDVSASANAKQSVSDRQQMVDTFQNDDKCKVIFCTESASREGWTGTAANNVIFMSKPWSSAYIRQCIGRAHRFGQQGGESKSVNVYSIITRNSIDERLEKLLDRKEHLITSVVEQQLSTKDVLNILGSNIK